MKKSDILIHTILFAAVTLVSFLAQSRTLDLQANLGLFLLTPDYFRETFSAPLPITHLLASFLTQFYDIPFAGELICAALITCIYLCLDAVLRRCGLPFHRVVSLACACAAWWLSAHAEDNTLVTGIALGCIIAALLSRLLKDREAAEVKLPEVAAVAVILAATCAFLLTDRQIRKEERLAAVQIDARHHRWDAVLRTATVDNSLQDPRLIPFAALALGEKGALLEEMRLYPINRAEDFDFEGENSQVGSFYNSLLSECLGSPNEALHHIFQFSCHRPHTLSHVSLYQMIKYNIEKGDITLARKYAEVLRRSPRNAATAAKMLRLYPESAPSDTLYRANPSSRVVTNNPVYNLALYRQEGLVSKHLTDRFGYYMLLQEDTDEDALD